MSVKLTIEVPAELVAALRDDKVSSIQKVVALDAIKLAAQNIPHDAATTAQADAQATENAPLPGPPTLDTSKQEPTQSTDTGAFQVFLRNLNGTTTVLMVSKDMTVRRLKLEIFNTGEVAPMFQRLRLLSGRVLGDTDDDVTLEESGVTQHSTIVLHLARPSAFETWHSKITKPELGAQNVSADPYSDLGTHCTFTIEVREFPQVVGRRWTITVHRSITVGQLKHMIEQRSGVEEKSQRFVVRGTELKDKNQTIEEVRATLGIRPIFMVPLRSTVASAPASEPAT